MIKYIIPNFFTCNICVSSIHRTAHLIPDGMVQRHALFRQVSDLVYGMYPLVQESITIYCDPLFCIGFHQLFSLLIHWNHWNRLFYQTSSLLIGSLDWIAIVQYWYTLLHILWYTILSFIFKNVTLYSTFIWISTSIFWKEVCNDYSYQNEVSILNNLLMVNVISPWI